jgi:hypothetical protein
MKTPDRHLALRAAPNRDADYERSRAIKSASLSKGATQF